MKILIEKGVIEQALEALEELHYSSGTVVAAKKYESATAALREALADQAEQEPVAWMDDDKWFTRNKDAAKKFGGNWTPLYAAPVRTKDLTDDEILKTNKTELPDCQDLVDFARAVIAADREKNRG